VLALFQYFLEKIYQIGVEIGRGVVECGSVVAHNLNNIKRSLKKNSRGKEKQTERAPFQGSLPKKTVCGILERFH
jgi:hypothetical protein